MTRGTGIHPETKLFEPFVDPIDLVLCVPADFCLQQINDEAQQHGMRFPLVCDPERTLAEHLQVTEYTSCSSRFGSLTDNILGMNWQLPNGTVARVGERVVKSTTGYDLRRFLLASINEFGTPLCYVLRLRPLCEATVGAQLTGELTRLKQTVNELRNSSWSHWIDQTDLVLNDSSACIELQTNCPAQEVDPFRNYFQSLSSKYELDIIEQTSSMNALPEFSVKSTFSSAVPFAQEFVTAYGGEVRIVIGACACLCHPSQTPAEETLESWSQQLAETGGHLHHSKQIEQHKHAIDLEQQWERLLKAEWGAVV